MFAQSLFGKSALGQYAITPTLLGTGLGGVYGAYEKATNPYARDPMSDYFVKGAVTGLAVGGLGASVGRGIRDYRMYEASKATSKYGVSGFNQALSMMR